MLRTFVSQVMRSRWGWCWLLLGTSSLAGLFVVIAYSVSPSPEVGRSAVAAATPFIPCHADSAAEAVALVEQALDSWYHTKGPIQVLAREAEEDEDGWRVCLRFQQGCIEKTACQMVRKSWVPSTSRPELDLMGPAVVWSR